jgi:uncharacterized protein (DUF1778 family)
MAQAHARTPRGGRIQRLEARVSQENKQLFAQAATLSGLSLTDFVVSTLRRAANELIERGRVLRLSTRDCKVFVDALINPPGPSENLQAAASRYEAGRVE